MTRGIVVVVAVVLLAWLAVTERNLRLQTSGMAATAKQDLAHAEDDFARASWLNPDTTPDLQRAFVIDARREHDRAIAVTRDVLRREPENRDAWGLLHGFVPDKRSPLAQRARAEVRRLNPLSARR